MGIKELTSESVPENNWRERKLQVLDGRGRSSLHPEEKDKGIRVQSREKVKNPVVRERHCDENFGGSSQRTQNGWN